MKLNDFLRIPFDEVLEQRDLVDTKIHSDDNGTIHCVELKYVFSDVDERNRSEVSGKKGW